MIKLKSENQEYLNDSLYTGFTPEELLADLLTYLAVDMNVPDLMEDRETILNEFLKDHRQKSGYDD